MPVLESLKNHIKGAFLDISIITYVLVVIFGTASWIAINGLWVELPIIVQEIPESWSLPSYLTVIIQLANIAPLAFTLGNKFYPRVVHEIPVIYISLGIGTASCVLLVFFWKETLYIAGAERSTALLVLCFFLSVVDCTSSVTFLPYMAIYREVYMSPYFLGEGLSGLIPSLVALGQGVGGGSHTLCPSQSPPQTPVNITNGTSNGTDSGSWGPGPKFPAEGFFWFLAGMMLASGLAFLGLNYLPVAKRQQVKTIYEVSPDGGQRSTLELVSNEQNSSGSNAQSHQGSKDPDNTTTKDSIFLMIILAVVSGLSNGVIPAIQSYACIPYSYYIYHLTLTLSNIANPVTCFVFPFIRSTSTLIIAVLSCVYFGMCTYILIVASQSPNVLLRCDDSGAVLIVFISVSAVAVVTYIKVAIGGIMREKGRKHLLWYGVSEQIGSCVGALAMFAPVNIYHYFKQE
ncbi:riboflavin transporter 2-like [Stylophora pistillata]|uniref:riboflavin transporter 2-like n=1 Tax=Stylophora pistillata TaxID=50429 RepID=UPI000C048A2F|nr:riboflavin transporter 2-like [Stylophora pistillata]